MGDHTSKTVIIVGAGASREFNLPIGDELMKLIIKSCSKSGLGWRVEDNRLDNLFAEISEKENFPAKLELMHASFKISKGLQYAQSIDNFLHSNKRDKAIIIAGKLAIASIINLSECNSTLYSGPIKRNSPTLKQGVSEKDSWLHRLFQILTSNKTYKQFIESLANLTFISFNYDRCIQQFFWTAAGAYFTTNENAREEIQEAINIIYVYGNVGKFSYSAEGTNFGNSKPEELIETVKTLRTFTEGERSGIRNTIEDEIQGAVNLLILGFGFIPINMDLLIKDKKFPGKVILSTALGISEPDREGLVKYLSSKFFWNLSGGSKPFQMPTSGFIRLENTTATGLFHEYSQYLSATTNKQENANIFLKRE